MPPARARAENAFLGGGIAAVKPNWFESTKILMASVDGVSYQLTSKDGTVQLAGFGTFSVSRRKARMGRNPRTGEPMKIAPSKGVRFKAGKEYKSML